MPADEQTKFNDMKEQANMADDAQAGTNARPLDDTVAGTGPGIPDDALAPGETELPTPPSDEDVRRAAKALDAPVPEREA